MLRLRKRRSLARLGLPSPTELSGARAAQSPCKRGWELRGAWQRARMGSPTPSCSYRRSPTPLGKQKTIRRFIPAGQGSGWRQSWGGGLASCTPVPVSTGEKGGKA